MSTRREIKALPPGPPGALLQLILYVAASGRYVSFCTKRYGDPFTVPTPYGPIVVVGTPEAAREVISADQLGLTGFASESVQVFLGERSLMLLGGEAHRRERRVLAPLFHSTKMQAYAARIAQITQRHLESIRPRTEFSALKMTQSISLSIIIEVLFGVVDSQQARAFEEAILRLVEVVRPGLFFFRALRRSILGLGPWASYQRAAAQLDALLYAEIARRRAHLDERNDILSGMLRARYDDGSSMDDATLRDQLVTLLIAGHETTGIALGWALLRLHRDAESLACVRGELAAFDSNTVHQHLDALPFLEAVCHESLRLDPIVPEFLRQLLKPMRLFGYELPAGTGVAISAAQIHRREELYPDAEAFRPRRFIGRSYGPHEYLPFGGGAFRCLGGAFALLEMRTILATLMCRAELELLEPSHPRPVRRNWVVGPAGSVPMRRLN